MFVDENDLEVVFPIARAGLFRWLIAGWRVMTLEAGENSRSLYTEVLVMALNMDRIKLAQ